MLEIFRQRHLLTLWLGQVFSAIGDRLYEIAIVWIAVKLTGSEAGFVLAAQAVSRLVFGLVGGVYADRLNRRSVMLASDVARAIVVLSLPLASLWGEVHLLHLMLVAVLVGALNAFFEPALIASLPKLTRSSRTLNALNALIDVTSRLARVIGPSLAGWLLVMMPISQFFTLDALSFILSALAIFSLGRHFEWQPQRDTTASQGIFGDIREAWGYLQARPHVLWCISANGITNLSWGCVFMVGAALLVQERFQGDAGMFGIIMAVYGAGNVLSNIVVSNLHIRRRPRMVFAGALLLGIGFVLLAFAPTFIMALVASALAALGGPMMDLSLLLMIQHEFPSHVVGKVFSARAMLSNAGYALGLALAAPLFAILPLFWGILFMSLVLMVLGFVGIRKFWQLEPSPLTEIPS